MLFKIYIIILLSFFGGRFWQSQNISNKDQQKINFIKIREQKFLDYWKILTKGKESSIDKVLKNNKELQPAKDRVNNARQWKQDGKVTKKTKNGQQTKNDKIDTLKIIKKCSSGGNLTVPENKIWKVKRVYINQGIENGYNILVTSIKFAQEYKSGEKIYAPLWSAEINLLTEDYSSINYIFEIEEINVEK